MARTSAVIERLPALYRDGPLVAAIAGVAGVQLEVAAERALEVQRAHWFDLAPDLDEVAGLGALLDIEPEPWQQRLGEYRVWVHALRNARLRHGAVTPAALQSFVVTYVRGFETANAVALVRSVTGWTDEPGPDAPAFVEFPDERRSERVPQAAPLQRFEIVNRGLDPAPLGFLLTGLAATAPEYVPVIVNLTTGRALVYRGVVPPGQRLWLAATPEGVSARLEDADVSDRVASVDVTSGVPWEASATETPAQPLIAERGANQLWFLPVAHYDELGLDRALLAFATVTGDDLRSVPSQGYWDDARLDRDIFASDAAVTLSAVWQETVPATVRVDLPAGEMVARDGGTDAGLDARERLATAVDEALRRLAAAGVRSSVRLRAHRDVQRTRDRLAAIFPLTHRSVGPTGADRVPDSGGVFGVTRLDDSTFR